MKNNGYIIQPLIILLTPVFSNKKCIVSIQIENNVLLLKTGFE